MPIAPRTASVGWLSFMVESSPFTPTVQVGGVVRTNKRWVKRCEKRVSSTVWFNKVWQFRSAFQNGTVVTLQSAPQSRIGTVSEGWLSISRASLINQRGGDLYALITVTGREVRRVTFSTTDGGRPTERANGSQESVQPSLPSNMADVSIIVIHTQHKCKWPGHDCVVSGVL